MKGIALLLLGGLVVAALTGQASAISLGGFSGGITMDITDLDVGSLYNVADGTYTGAATLNGLPQTSVAGQGVPAGAANINGSLSDTMGIFRINNIQTIGTNQFLFQSSANDELTAIFWGLTDTYLSQTTDSSGVHQQIHGTSLQIAIFENTSGVTNWPGNGAPGPGSFSVGPNGTDGKAKLQYTAITTGKLVWTMRSTSGLRFDFLTGEFFDSFNQGSAAYSSVGNFLANMTSVDGWGSGADNYLLDTQTVPAFQTGDSAGTPTGFADVTYNFHGTQENNSNGTWLLLTRDPVDAFAQPPIPEPVTMAGLLLGVGCLTRYIRKRR